MTNLKPDFIAFAEHVIDALNLKVSKDPKVLDSLFEDYKAGHFIHKPGLIWINYIVANFFEQSPDDLRRETRKEEIVRARSAAMYFAHYYNHQRNMIAQFYNCTGGNVSHAIKRVEKILGDKDSFSDRKILSILKYELL